jgi:inorganic pyrophosphatase
MSKSRPRRSRTPGRVEAGREELEQFFITASAMSDKKVVIDGWEGPKAARKVIEEAAGRYVRRGLE